MIITDQYLDIAFILCFSDKLPDLSSIRTIVKHVDLYKKLEKDNIPVSYENKIECLLTACKLRLDGKNKAIILDNLTSTKKFESISSYLKYVYDKDVSKEEIKDYINQTSLKDRIVDVLGNYKQIKNFLEKIESNSYDSLEDILLDYNQLIRGLYVQTVEANRNCRDINNYICTDNNDFTQLSKSILSKYDRESRLPTGYSLLDNEVFYGGFEKSRIYVIVGTSGGGKSTLLRNFIINGAEQLHKRYNKNIFVAITLEDTIEEFLLKMYQNIFNKTVEEAIEDFKQYGDECLIRVKEYFDERNSLLVLKYFPATKASPLDISMILDETVESFGKENIRGLFVDYLDLLSSDIKFDLFRIELGYITLSLKTIAIDYDIPVITLSQLNRSAFRVSSSFELNLDQVSESVQKIHHSDCIMLLARDLYNDDIVHFKVGKNRSGRSNVPLDFVVNFDKQNFIRCLNATNNRNNQQANVATFDNINPLQNSTGIPRMF